MIEIQDGRKLAGALRDRIIATIFLLAVCCCTLVAAAKSGYTVNVVADGKIITVNTSEQSADVILEQAGVTLGEKDKLNTDNFVIGNDADNGNKIVVIRAVPVTIIEGDEPVATVTLAGTVADALKEAQVECRAEDSVNYDMSTPLKDGMEIKIQRSFSIDVISDDQTRTIRFLGGTVSDVLKKLNITLGENDEVSPSLTSEVEPGKTIKVNRVTYEERTETEVIKYKTITKKSSALDKGVTRVEKEGKNGERSVVYRDKIVDGKVVESTVVSQDIISKSVDKVVVVGTKIKILSTTGSISKLSLPSRYTLSDGVPTNAISTITGRSTAYTADAGARTSTGIVAQSGYVAVNPTQIPYGTEMFVVSTDGKYVYGYCIAADTGGFIKHGKTAIDLYMDTLSECYQWGNREVCIYILKWGNGKV